jgi:uncharacterized protein (DUF58 family)
MHWKQTARQQRLVVVERKHAAEKSVFFVLDPRLVDPSDPHQLERFEHLVSEVATGIVRRLREGVRVGLVVGSLVVPPVRSMRRAPVLLSPLAEVEALGLDEAAPARVGNGRMMVFRVAGSDSR